MADHNVLQKVELPDRDLLIYKGKPDVKRASHLVISNPTDTVVAFKIKATSPAFIRIGPGYGFVKPKEKKSVAITVLPFKDRLVAPKLERVVVLLAVAPADLPKVPQAWWYTSPAVKNARRQVYPIKFFEDGKVTKQEAKKEEPYDETEESSVQESTRTTEESA